MIDVLPVKHNKDNGFCVVRVHYSADPDKDAKWVAEAKKGMPKRGWLREYEIDYSTYAGKPFFPEFSELNIAKKTIAYTNKDIIYRGWDFGFHRPCVLITKLNEFDQWCWLRVIMGQDEGIYDFGQRVRRFCMSEYPGSKFIDACDPAGHQKTDKNEKTSVQILNNLGIYPQSRRQSIAMGAEIVRQKLIMRTDGKVGLIVNPGFTDAIDGFKGGIHYPETREGREQKEAYYKDGYYDHLFDSSRYLAVEMFTIIGQTQDSNEILGNNRSNLSGDVIYDQSQSMFDDGIDLV